MPLIGTKLLNYIIFLLMALIFIYAFNFLFMPDRNKTAELYLPSTFQTSDIEILNPKIET